MDIFTKRGINPDVVTIRGYQRYEDPEDVYAVDWRWRFFPGNLRKWCSKSSGSPGWVMPKYSVLPGLHHPLAQLRPDDPIRSETYGHDHDGMVHLEKDCPCGIADHSEGFLSRRRPRLPMGDHERAMHEGGKRHTDDQGNPVRDPDTGEEIPLLGPHRHVKIAKYLLPPGPHGIRLERHPSTDFSEHLERVFFVLEGTPKNDSLVSRGEASFDVPSVTTWWKERMEGIDRFLSPDAIDDAAFESYRRGMLRAFQEGVAPWETGSELQAFAETCLRGTPVVVVCDSDWHHNPEVATQALVCRDKLIEYGCPAMVAAPPEGPVLHVRDREEIRQKVGVDDFLGRDNGHRDGDPDDLLIVDPQPGPGFERFARDYKRHARAQGRKAFSAEFDVELVRWAVKHSAATGAFKRPVPTVAQQMEVAERTIFNATERLRDHGAFLIDKLTPVVEKRYIRRPGRPRPLNIGRGHAGKTPTIVLRVDLAPPPAAELRVGDWLRSL
jgi:hypothetical protein